MKATKLTISTLLASVILTSCIKNKQESTLDNSLEMTDIQIAESYTEDSIDTLESTIDQIVIADVSGHDEDDENSQQVYTSVDVMPEFTGGAIAMKTFFKDNLSSNVDSEGRVIVRFIVDSKGNIKEPTIQRSLSPNCDKEALRVIKEMPQWTPGKKKGKAVSVYYTLPVLFRSNN